jgi:hypothetical protein
MGWGDVLSFAGGAARGAHADYAHQMDEEQQRQMLQERLAYQQQVAELRALVQSKGIETTADTKDKDRKSRDANAEAERKRRTDETIGKLDRLYSKDASDEALGWGRIGATEHGQDQADARFWGGTMPFKEEELATRDATTRRGQDVGASSSKYRADTAAASADKRTEAVAGSTSTAQRARNALGILGLKARQKPSIFGTTQSPTDFAAEFDRLYNDPSAAASDALDAADAGDSAPAVTMPSKPPVPVTPRQAAPVAAPPAAVAKPPVPVAPRPAAATTPQRAAPAGVVPGATVTLRSGKKVTVTKVNPDGTFEYQ